MTRPEDDPPSPAQSWRHPIGAPKARCRLSPPNIAPYKAGNTGIPWVYSFDSGHPGPHVMITAAVHGNELCGAIVLDEVLHAELRPCAGRLTLAFANPAALLRFDPTRPGTGRFVDEDLNRLWTPAVLDGPRVSVELTRARLLRPLVDSVDLLLDLHSMQTASPPLVLAGVLAKGRDLARRVGIPAVVVSDAGHQAGTRLRDYGPFGAPSSPKTALLVECGQHGDAASVSVARQVTWRFLATAGIIDAAQTRSARTVATPPRQRFIEVTDAVTVTTNRFTYARPFANLDCLGPAGTLIGHDGPHAIVTPYDHCVLIMPARTPIPPGKTAVRLGRDVDPETHHPIPPPQ